MNLCSFLHWAAFDDVGIILLSKGRGVVVVVMKLLFCGFFWVDGLVVRNVRFSKVGEEDGVGLS